MVENIYKKDGGDIMKHIQKIFFASGPWPSVPLFWGLIFGADMGTVPSALFASLYALGYTLVALGADRVTKLDYGVVLFWACGITLGLIAPPTRVIYFFSHFSTFLYLSLFAMAYLPLVFGAEPFTVAMAKRKTPEMYWNTTEFISINRIMTSVWAGIFIIALLISLIPSFWTQVLFPIVFVMGAGIPFTRKFPDLYLKAKGLGAVMSGEAQTRNPINLPHKQIKKEDHMSRIPTDEERKQVAEKEGPIKNALVVFGSPRGAKGFTYKALNRFQEGTRDGGINSEIIFLKDHKIRPCIGCYTCWSKTPGVCVHKDDMASLLEKVKEADLVIYAQPLYVFTVPGITKNFLDRQIPLLEPFLIERPDGSTGHPHRYNGDNRSRMLLFSVCGFPEKDHFNAMVEMFRLMSRAGGTPIIGEILRPSSESMRFGESMGKNYRMVMDALFRAGKEVADQGYVSVATEDIISSPFIPDVRGFRNLGNRFWNTWIEYEKQKKAGHELPDLETYLSSDLGIYFAGMAAGYDPAKAGDFEGTFQFNINGDHQSTYSLEIKNHQCVAREGKASKADLVIHTPLEVWKAIGEGKISGQEGLMQGKYRVEGDLGLLIKMGEIFSA